MLKTILLQAETGLPFDPQLILFVGIGLVFYFFIFRPQQKKQKEQKKFLEEIKRGDQVVTLGGLHGKVLSSDDSTVTLEVDKGVKLKFQKGSISKDASQAIAESDSKKSE